MESLLPRFVEVPRNVDPDSISTIERVVSPNDSCNSQHAFQMDAHRDDVPIRPIRRCTLTGDEGMESIDSSEIEDMAWGPDMAKAAKRLSKVISKNDSKHLRSEEDSMKMDKIAGQESRTDLQLVKEQIQEIHTMLSMLINEKNNDDCDSNRGPLRSVSPTRNAGLPRTRSIRHARSSSSKDGEGFFATLRRGKRGDSTIDSDKSFRSRSRKSKSKSSRTNDNSNNSNAIDTSFRSHKSSEMNDKNNNNAIDTSFRSQKTSKTSNNNNSINAIDTSYRSRKSRSNTLDSTSQRARQILDKQSVLTTSTKSDSIESDWEDSSLDERLERDYGVLQRLGRYNSFQPGMQHFAYHPSSNKHLRRHRGRTTDPSFDGHQSDPVLHVSQTHHPRSTAGGFDGHSSEPCFDFQNREPPQNFKAIPQLPFTDTPPRLPNQIHRTKSLHNRKLISLELSTKPNKDTKYESKSRRHPRRSCQNSPIAATVSTSPER